MKQFLNFINGEFVATGKTFENRAPANNQVIGLVHEAGQAEVDAAVAAARAAFDHGPWPRMAPAERFAVMKRMSEILHARVGETASAWTLQMGGLASFSPFMQGGSNATFDGIIAMAEGFHWVEQRPTVGAAVGLIAYEPVGVVAAIAPTGS